MKYTLELPINRPRTEVWAAFDNPHNIKQWQRSLTSYQSLSGKPGRPGAISKLTFEEHGRQFELTEKVIYREEPNRFDSTFKNDFAENTVKNTFIEENKEQTLWRVETEYKFKTLVMRVLGPLMKKNYAARTQKDMGRFKEMVEKQPST
jgi:uncharacterized protein YndB with AHSA1/START domain